MAEMASGKHRFRVMARHVDHHHARVIEETSFEAAAVAYVEDLVPLVDESGSVSVIVRDLDNGHEHCFIVDPGTGDSEPCG